MIGFIQGRLTPSTTGKLQFFPWNNWKREFQIAKENNFNLMEWTIDMENIQNNPLFTNESLIKKLSIENKLSIKSITCDFLMEYPFYKDTNYLPKKEFNSLKYLEKTIIACEKLCIDYIIFPLVDSGRIENKNQEEILIEKLTKLKILNNSNCQILFETDFSPSKQLNFISKFKKESFGINYDTGNSASMGFNVKEEMDIYFKYIKNIHIKDRKFKSESVKLGSGDFNFNLFFSLLKKLSYSQNMILQTARENYFSETEDIIFGYNFIRGHMDVN